MTDMSGTELTKSYHHYVEHAKNGRPLREIARREGVAASTVMRQIRKIEAKRDDPLVDRALDRLEGASHAKPTKRMTQKADPAPNPAFGPEALRILRRLQEASAVLVSAPDMERAAVLRQVAGGPSIRTAVCDRALAEAFVLRDWIVMSQAGRPAVYKITPAGRAALKRMLAEAEPAADGFAEAMQPFADQHRDWGQKAVLDDDNVVRRHRYNMAESPVVALGRRRDKDGVPFLTPEQVAAGECLREDFELAQMGPRIAQNWDRFLTGPAQGGYRAGSGPLGGSAGARARVEAALCELGPGLGDMVLRCCCYLEGLETAEKRLGWAARSGKIVLRIALDRLRQYYASLPGAASPLIG